MAIEHNEGQLPENASEETKVDYQLNSQYSEYFDNNKDAFNYGKLFLAVCSAMTDMDSAFNELLVKKDYNSLNAISAAALSGDDSNARVNRAATGSEYSYKIKRLLKAMSDEKILDEISLGASAKEEERSKNTKEASLNNIVAASMDPAIWLTHSWYDMIVHDCRGRMLRAFPTFYLALIDEGRRIGRYKLHDNFYNNSSISNITIVKSRKMPMDTAEITMSNFFSTFTNEDEDIHLNYINHYADVFDSLVAGFGIDSLEYAQKEERKRTNAQPVERVKIRPGANVMIKIGYGADASKIPIAFNGVVAEVDTGDIVTLQCQGYGGELLNVIPYEKKAHELYQMEDIVNLTEPDGITPKQFVKTIFSIKNSPISRYLNDVEMNGNDDDEDLSRKTFTSERYWIDASTASAIKNIFGIETNTFGIYHFGNPESPFQMAGDIEPLQNVFEPGTADALRYDYKKVRENYIFDVVDDGKDWLNDGLFWKNVKGGIRDLMSEATTIVSTATGTVTVIALSPTGPVISAIAGAGASYIAGEATEGVMNFFGLNLTPEEEMIENIPEISFEVAGKTVWDTFHICRSIDPSYILSVENFGLRSTLFMGKKNDYYAYDYTNTNGVWCERRKPFQQFHVYNSMTDIINNNIILSSDIYTNAIGLYKIEGSITDDVKQTDVKHLDVNIFSEYQKTMMVDTGYYGVSSNTTGIRPVDWVVNRLKSWATSTDIIDEAFDDKGDWKSHKRVAEKMTTTALKDNLKDMYQGQITVIGDPTVKPFDRIALDDSYHAITGQIEVKDVVHVFSAEDGFKTVITPDLLVAAVGEDSAEISQSVFSVSNVVKVAETAVLHGLLANLSERSLEKYIKKFCDADTVKWFDSTIGRAANYIKSTDTYNTVANNKVSNIVTEKLSKVSNAVTPRLSTVANRAVGLEETTIRRLKGIKYIDVTKNNFARRSVYMAGAFAILGGITNTVRNKLESRKSCTLFPLTKYNRVMTAGVQGHVGTVYGSPTWNQKDLVESEIFSTLLDSRYDGDNLIVKGAGAALRTILSYDYADYDTTTPGHKSRVNKVSDREAKSIASANTMNNGYVSSHSLRAFEPSAPRFDVISSKEKPYIKQVYGINKNTESEIRDALKTSNKMDIIKDPAIQNYMNKGLFKVFTEEKDVIESLSGSIETMELRGSNTKVYKKDVEFSGKTYTCYDSSFLDQDAIVILTKILEIGWPNINDSTKDRDLIEFAKNSNDYILFSSGTVFGSPVGFESTGFSFILTTKGSKAKECIRKGIETLNDEQNKHNKVNPIACKTLIVYERNGDNWKIFVAPRKYKGR